MGKKTDLFVRFSTVAGERGAADAERDIRGFAVKMYTEEGNWDLVGNNTPVFFFRDPLKFPDLNHAVKRDPRTNMRSAQNNWDFWSSAARGAPPDHHRHERPRHPRELPPHARLRQPHLQPHQRGRRAQLGQVPLASASRASRTSPTQEAEVLVGKDRESHQRDLYEAIENKDFPKWKLCVQVMPEKDAARPTSSTPSTSPRSGCNGDYPLIEVGVMELNKNPENYFADVEQAAFNPANVVPGIGFSPDKMLQGRLFSYGDAQRYRLGVNHHLIPVNAARCPVHGFSRDGAMRVDGNYGSTLHYEPNSYGEWQEQPEFTEPPLDLYGAADRWDARKDDDDYYTQPGLLFRLIGPEKQKLLFENTARNMAAVTEEVKLRHIGNCFKADPAYGEGVAAALGIPMSKVKK